ncbi:MAG TPA: ATP-binding protein, partial [Actinomycetota bacterium]|nr:ATP-binding protein [Actinomycetota bacterium]
MKREFTCVPVSAAAVRGFVAGCLDRLRASDETRFEVLVAVTEAVANVVRHAPTTGRFEVDCVAEGRSVVVTVRD